MRLLSDERAQSIQIGAVLLFAVLIILLSTWQAFVVPNQNEEIEFNHNEDTQQQLTELRTTVNSMPNAASIRSATVDLGVRYPSRTIFRNPPPASGTIRTVGTTESGFNVSIENATAVEDDLDDFWTGSARQYDTGAIEYQPRYSEYREAPRTIYEHSVLYNKFDREDQELSITGQTLVRDDRITIVALNGTLRENRIDSTSIDFEPISTQTRTVRVGNASHNVTISSPTAMNEDEWQTLFEDEMVDNGGHVLNVTTTEYAGSEEFSMLEVTLEPGNYSLQLAKVGVGTGTTGTESAYIVGTDGDDTNVSSGDSHTFTVEVRDKFNKPRQGVDIEGVIENKAGSELTGQTLKPTRDDSKTGSDGTLSFRYDTSSLDIDPGEQKTVYGNFSFDGGNTSQQYVALKLTVSEPKQTNGSGEFVAGPVITNISKNDTVTKGQNYTLNATVSSIGDGNTIRSGTPIQNVTYNATSESGVNRSGIIQDYDPDLSNRTEQPETTIDTTGWESGNHTFMLTAQDASGRTNSAKGPTITIVNKSQADNAQRVTGTGAAGGNKRPQFSVNVTNGQVTLDSAALLTRNSLSGVGAKSTGGESIVNVDGTDSLSASTSDGSFAYEFNPNLTLAASDGNIGVEFDQLDTNIENFASTTDTTNSDLVISFKFGDGSVKEFHFTANVK